MLHLGATVTVDTLDAEYGITITRADELAFPAEWDRAPSVSLYVESKSLAAGQSGDEPMHACVDIALSELPHLINALTGQLWAARLMNGSTR
ncbi:MAG TPA: hypothetical protein VHH34_11200 [Pseudonocardiaceae bacterium]|nr:hypothetical protein [Pseudonocardiaceae bacterium]